MSVMKKIFRICAATAVAVTMAACGSGAKQGVSWDTAVMPAPQLATPEDEIEVSYPIAVNGEASGADMAINRQIWETIGGLLGYPHSDTPEVAVDRLLADRSNDSIAEPMPYAVHIDGDVRTIGRVASVRLGIYAYTGGAHGLGTDTYLNFDTHTGVKLEVADLFTDTTTLRNINRAAFAALLEKELKEAVLFVDVDELPLPASGVGIDSAGVYIHYNPYEIMPYVYGPTDYTLPFAEIEPLLNKKAFK